MIDSASARFKEEQDRIYYAELSVPWETCASTGCFNPASAHQGDTEAPLICQICARLEMALNWEVLIKKEVDEAKALAEAQYYALRDRSETANPCRTQRCGNLQSAGDKLCSVCLNFYRALDVEIEHVKEYQAAHADKTQQIAALKQDHSDEIAALQQVHAGEMAKLQETADALEGTVDHYLKETSKAQGALAAQREINKIGEVSQRNRAGEVYAKTLLHETQMKACKKFLSETDSLLYGIESGTKHFDASEHLQFFRKEIEYVRGFIRTFEQTL